MNALREQSDERQLPDLWDGPLSLPADMSAANALAAMRRSGQRCALVVAWGAPFALVTEADLEALHPDEAIGDRVEWEVLRVPAEADERQTVRLHENAAWRWLRRPWAARRSEIRR